MITIKDVAKLAGVSIQTVSNVINNRSTQLTEETRNKVLRAIKDLGYKPSYLARSLRTGKTMNIGLLIPDITYPFYPEIADVVEDVARTKGYNLILCTTHDDPKREDTYVEVLMNKWVDGILWARVLDETKTAERVTEAKIPLVAILRAVDNYTVPSVLTDNIAVGYEATKHLVELGHRRIACIYGTPKLRTYRDRLSGHKKALEEAGIAYDLALAVESDYKNDQAYRDMSILLERDDTISSVFAFNDFVGIQCIRAIKRRGLRVPQDISVVGVDGIRDGLIVEPPLTTMVQPISQLASSAMNLLVQIIHNEYKKETSDEEVVLKPKLEIRGSTAAKKNR